MPLTNKKLDSNTINENEIIPIPSLVYSFNTKIFLYEKKQN